jgi:hypothetical protein
LIESDDDSEEVKNTTFNNFKQAFETNKKPSGHTRNQLKGIRTAHTNASVDYKLGSELKKPEKLDMTMTKLPQKVSMDLISIVIETTPA